LAKRFTDTGKWDKAWYRQLGAELRDLRQYLLDKCDFAGLIDVDFDTIAHFTGSTITVEKIDKALRGRGVWIRPDKLFIPDFIEFQYGVLKKESKPHQAAIRALERHSIDAQKLSICERYPKGIRTLKDTDKEQDSDKEQEHGKFETLESFLASLPQKTKDGWAKLYTADFISRQSILAWNYYETKKHPKNLAGWSRALGSWFERTLKWDKRDRPAKGSEYGGWEHIDGVS
jgi:hypothetical protein